MDYEELTKEQIELAIMNASVKSLISTAETFIMQYSTLKAPTDFEKADHFAHYFADVMMMNFVGNLIKNKTNTKHQGALKRNIEIFIENLRNWLIKTENKTNSNEMH